MDDELLLTDDEVIALALEREVSWPAAMPTVDPTNDAAQLAASFRGMRSLTVRGLRSSSGMSQQFEELVDAITSRSRAINAYLGDDDLVRSSWGLATSHYDTELGWILETVSPVGIHTLGRQEPGDVMSFLAALVAAALEEGPAWEGDHDASLLCLVCEQTAGLARVVTVRRGELKGGALPLADGFLKSAGSLRELEMTDALGFLLGTD